MSDMAPGLQPKEVSKAQTIETKVVSDRVGELPASTTSSEQVPVSPPSEQQVVDNTTAPTDTPKETVKVEAPQETTEQREFSEKASKRFQTIVNALEEERVKRLTAEQQLQRLVMSQPQPKPEEALVQQYKSFDKSLGYPTDPKEYSDFVGQRAEQRADAAAERRNKQLREQQDITDLMKNHPDTVGDDILVGAIAAERNAAARRGESLTLSEAAALVKDKLAKKYTREFTKTVANDIASKNEAYVETTKGAATTRQAEKPKTEFKNLAEMEAEMKKQGIWNNGFSN
jgi:hypothetical protein